MTTEKFDIEEFEAFKEDCREWYTEKAKNISSKCIELLLEKSISPFIEYIAEEGKELPEYYCSAEWEGIDYCFLSKPDDNPDIKYNNKCLFMEFQDYIRKDLERGVTVEKMNKYFLALNEAIRIMAKGETRTVDYDEL